MMDENLYFPPHHQQQRRLPVGRSKLKQRWDDIPSARTKSVSRKLFRSNMSTGSESTTTTIATGLSLSDNQQTTANLSDVLEQRTERREGCQYSTSTGATATTGPIDVDSVQEYQPSPSDITSANAPRRRLGSSDSSPVDVDSYMIDEKKKWWSLVHQGCILNDEQEDSFSRGLVGYQQGFEPPVDNPDDDLYDTFSWCDRGEIHQRRLYEVSEDGTYEV